MSDDSIQPSSVEGEFPTSVLNSTNAGYTIGGTLTFDLVSHNDNSAIVGERIPLKWTLSTERMKLFEKPEYVIFTVNGIPLDGIVADFYPNNEIFEISALYTFGQSGSYYVRLELAMTDNDQYLIVEKTIEARL